MVYCCIASVLLSIDPSIVSIKKLVCRPCARFRYLLHKYVDDENAKGRNFGRTHLAGKLLNQLLSPYVFDIMLYFKADTPGCNSVAVAALANSALWITNFLLLIALLRSLIDHKSLCAIHGSFEPFDNVIIINFIFFISSGDHVDMAQLANEAEGERQNNKSYLTNLIWVSSRGLISVMDF
jgi:hypothetical protein